MGNFFAAALIAFGTGLAAFPALGQEVTLRLHHFLPPSANLHAKLVEPWVKDVQDKSGGRIKIDTFTAMSLGGTPAQLYDQAVDGAVDIILTLPGYSAGRFPRAEVFELPFLTDDTVAASKAYWDMVEASLQDTDFNEAKILAAWVHGPGVLHSRKPITALEDIAGMELRGATRLVTDLLGEIGASPVGMPLPSIAENVSKGVISGAALPWEVVPAIKLHELVANHTEFGDKVLYTAVFVIAMNWDAYDDLPDDLRQILDEASGKGLSTIAAEMVVREDAASRALAQGNTIIELDEAEVARWQTASRPVYARWIEGTVAEGFAGRETLSTAQRLIEANRTP